MPLVKVQSRGTENVGSATKNVLINGGFTVSQRNGTTLTATANNTYFLDRWKLYLNGSCAVSTQQMLSADSNVTALNTATGETFNNVLSIDCTTSASLGSTDLLGIIQMIEGNNSVPLSGQSCTLSFHVKSNVTGQYYVAFKISGSGERSYLVGYTISSANTWEKKTITFVNDTLTNLNSNASVTTSSGLQVYFGLRLGTSGQMSNTLNAWQSGNYYGKSDQVTWGTSTSDSFYMGGVQLEIGSQASDFQHRSFGEELKLCHRYYQQFAYDTHGFNVANGGANSASQSTHVYTYYGGEMRVAPSVSTPSVSGGYRFLGADQDNSHSTIPNIDNAGKASVQFGNNQNTITKGHHFRLLLSQSGAMIKFDAEL